jgi:hypothetical protein
VICRCEQVTELLNAEAKTYADAHLEQVGLRDDGWTVVYRCPDTGREWIEEYPRSEEHGGGPMRLRQSRFVGTSSD